MNSTNLKEYIKKIYKLESALYTQGKIRHDLSSKIMQIEKQNKYAYNDTNSYNISEYIKETISDACIFLITGTIMGFLIFFLSKFGNIFHYSFKEIFLKSFSYGWKIALALTILIIIIQIWRHFAYDIKEKKQAINKNLKIKNYNDNVEYQKRYVLPVYKQQLQKINELYADTQKVLHMYYQKNIVYKKYQNLVAIASFYEYLDSGICSKLEGHEGCYNKYDTELQLKTIIEKLDVIIEKLDQIEMNQHMLYTAIKEGNNIAKRIESQISTLVKDNREYNTKLEYYAEENARNIADIKWINTFEYLNRS